MAERDDFDPYRIWLGIPLAEQPPTYYRLLGIVEFESDPDVISNAADRCMAHIRTFQTGARAELSQKMLNELSIARTYLLDPQRRLEYDTQLRRRRAALSPPPAPVTPLAMSPMAPVPVAAPIGVALGATAVAEPAAEVPAFSARSSSSPIRQRVRKKSSPLPWLAVVAVLVLAGLVGAIILRQEPAATLPKETAQPKQPPRVITIPRDDSSKQPNKTTTTGGAPVVDVRSTSGMDDQRGRERARSVEEALDRVVSELSRQNPWRAKQLLDDARALSPSAKQTERLGRLTKLFDYLESYRAALLAGVRQLQPGQTLEIDLGGRRVSARFVETAEEGSDDARFVVFEVDGQRRNYRVANLPVPWSLAIARTRLDESGPAARLAVATYVAVANNSDRELARQLWEALVAEGLADKALAGELKLELTGKVTASTPLPEMPAKPEPDKPSPEPQPEPMPSAGGKSPLPPDSEILEARRKFREEYRERSSKAKSAEDKLELAQELLTAAESAEPYSYRYVLHLEAIQLAVEACSPETFGPMIDDLALKFSIDPLELKLKSLTEASGEASSAEHGEALYLVASEAYAVAKEVRRYDVAEKIARLAARAALRAQDPETSQGAELEARKMQTLHQLTTAALAALPILKEKPDDPAACAAAGRWECFVKENWADGLKLLSQGDDKPLAELAQADLAGPTEPKACGELAARWLQTAKQQKDGAKAAPLHRAKHWYEQALGRASDTEKASFEKSVQEIDTLLETAG